MTTPSPTGTYNWVDPRLIPDNRDMLIVLVDDRRGFLGWLIKAHESGNYNHVMFKRKLETFVSQANVFKEVSIEEYMKEGIFLKFWKITATPDEINIINLAIDKKLAQPWYKKMYDLPGLFGQAFPFLHWIQIPGLYFCSEVVSAFLRLCVRFSWITKEPSPSDLDRLFKQHPNDIRVIGYYWQD